MRGSLRASLAGKLEVEHVAHLRVRCRRTAAIDVPWCVEIISGGRVGKASGEARKGCSPAQVMPHVWSRVCRGDLSRPADNIDCGARILAVYLRACGDYTCALARYNGAAGPANGAGRRYVAKIDAQRQRLRKALL